MMMKVWWSDAGIWMHESDNGNHNNNNNNNNNNIHVFFLLLLVVRWLSSRPRGLEARKEFFTRNEAFLAIPVFLNLFFYVAEPSKDTAYSGGAPKW